MPTRVVNQNVDEIYRGDQGILGKKKVMFEDVREEKEVILKDSCFKSVCCSDDSSSIGKNSDLSENSLEKSGDDEEVQSLYKGPLDAMEALEEVLPIRKGISRFYNGKSKSFASLSDASSSSSIKDIAKPENPYVRKRRNLLSYNLNWDKPRSSPLRGNGGAITKRVTSSSRTTLALAVAMKNSEQCNSMGGRKDFSTWRSFSFADLEHCSAVSISNENNK